MSIHRHNARVVPRCRGRNCPDDADLVVAFEDREAMPFCHPCGNAVRYADDTVTLEYPLEEFYTPSGHRVSAFDPDDEAVFDLFNPDQPHEERKEWISADNRGDFTSSVDPRDNV